MIKNYFFFFFILGIILFLSSSGIRPNELTSREILNKMFTETDKITSLKFKMKKKEKVGNKMLTGEQDVKFVRSPKKIYTKVISPNKGAEVLYVHGKYNNKAFVNPNGFPYTTLSLDPYGSVMRNNNHHTVHEVGFDYIVSIVSYIAKKSEKDFDKFFQYSGDTIIDNRKCYKILIDYTPFNYVEYKVKKGENLVSIAYDKYISDYMILTLNKNLSGYDDVKEGQIIKIPNAYARKTFLYVDKENFLPILQRMHDEKGLFAEYQFQNVILNPSIPEEEFTKEYKDYGF